MKVIPALRNVSNAHTRIAFLVVAVTKRIESFFSTQQRCNEYDFFTAREFRYDTYRDIPRVLQRVSVLLVISSVHQ